MTDSTAQTVSTWRPVQLLGAAFLLQAIGSAASGLLLAPVDLLANSAPDDMAATMADIAANEGLLRASILGEMITAGGIVALGVMLYTLLRRYGQHVAGVALGLYLRSGAVSNARGAGVRTVVDQRGGRQRRGHRHTPDSGGDAL